MFTTVNRCIPVKNTGGRSADIFYEGKFIAVLDIEFSFVFSMARIVHKFNSRIVVN